MRQVVKSNIKHLFNGSGNPTGEAFQNAQRVLPQPLCLILSELIAKFENEIKNINSIAFIRRN